MHLEKWSAETCRNCVTFHSEIASCLTVIQTYAIKHSAISFTVNITPAVINLTPTSPHLSYQSPKKSNLPTSPHLFELFVLRDLVSTPHTNTSFHPFVTLYLISGYFNVQLDLSTAKIIPENGNYPMARLGWETIDFTSLKDTARMLFHPLYGFCNIKRCTVADYAQTEILQGRRGTTHQSWPQSQ